MRFGYACPLGHELIENFHCGHAPPAVICPTHQETAPRVFDVPHFVEDRLRFYQAGANAPSGRWSYALGQEMPETRAERDRLCREKGIEMVTKAEMLIPPPEPKKPEKGWLKREIDKRGIRFGDYAGIPQLTREGAERKLRDDRPEWSESDAVTPKNDRAPT